MIFLAEQSPSEQRQSSAPEAPISPSRHHLKQPKTIDPCETASLSLVSMINCFYRCLCISPAFGFQSVLYSLMYLYSVVVVFSVLYSVVVVFSALSDCTCIVIQILLSCMCTFECNSQAELT